MVVFISACVVISNTHENSSLEKERYNTLGAHLINLSASVQFEMRFGEISLSDKQLLVKATSDDKALLTPFTNLTLKAKPINDNGTLYAIILICNEKGTKALFEDITYTNCVEKNHWQNNIPCEYILNAGQFCNR